MRAIIPLVIIVAIVGLLFLVSKTITINTNENQSPTPVASVVSLETMNPTASPSANLQIVDEVVGTGAEAVAGKSVTVNYVGTLTDGTKFDSSYDRNQPFTFDLGAGEVIQGWDQGVVGMKVGGKRKLTIPSNLGYGAAGAPPAIPANATLIFEIELLKVE